MSHSGVYITGSLPMVYEKFNQIIITPFTQHSNDLSFLLKFRWKIKSISKIVWMTEKNINKCNIWIYHVHYNNYNKLILIKTY